MFNIWCDEKIPFARQAFEQLGHVTHRKSNRLTSTDLKDVDVLVIRSGTRVDRSLLDGTPVQFVASATSGADHVDRAYLREAGIPFYHAPGCNADSVVEYVIAALITMGERLGVRLDEKTAGIVGAGHIGSRLASRLDALGMNVIINDPPLLDAFPEKAEALAFTSLDSLIRISDIVTFHVPLTRGGQHPTFHLIDEGRLRRMKPGAWLINASRGAVVSNQALRAVRQDRHLGAVVLDVWEGEPGIDRNLLERVDIGTPHIAGYSYDGKAMGTIMVYEAMTEHFELEKTWDYQRILQPNEEDHLYVDAPSGNFDRQTGFRDLVRQMYDIEEDDMRLRALGVSGETEWSSHFLRLRKEYPRRRSFSLYTVRCTEPLNAGTIRRLEHGLGVRLSAI